MNPQKNIDYLHTRQIENIKLISLPYRKIEEDEIFEGKYTTLYEEETYKDCYWRVSYLNGCGECFYQHETKRIL